MPQSAAPVAPGPDTGTWEDETLDAVLAKFPRVLLADNSKTLAGSGRRNLIKFRS